MDAVHAYLATIRTKVDNVQLFNEFEAKTNVPKEYAAVGGAVIVALILLLGGIGSSTISIAGFLYPAYMSVKAIESRAKSDVTQWLIYWVVYSFFSIIEVFSVYLIYWIPYYYQFKLAFLLWAMLPSTRGAKFLYDSFLKDFLKQNESKIDAALKDAKTSASKVAAEASKATNDAASAISENMKKSENEKKDE